MRKDVIESNFNSKMFLRKFIALRQSALKTPQSILELFWIAAEYWLMQLQNVSSKF